MTNLQAWFAEVFLPNITPPPLWAQALNCVGEAGEFAEAFRRYTGNARRSADLDEVMLELADIVIAAFGFAALVELEVATPSLDRYIDRKLSIIMDRGFGAQANNHG